MKLQKIILCVAVALTAFGVSLGLLDLGSYLRTGFYLLGTKVEPKIPNLAPITYYPPRPAVYQAPPVYVPPTVSEDIAEGSGDYFIVGKTPKGFENFDELWILTSEYVVKKQMIVPIKPYGAIQTTREFKFKWINISGKQVSLATQTHKGVSYQFDGKLVDEEEQHRSKDGDEYTTYIALKGRLTKWRDGKKIAEAKVRFEIGGC